MLDERETAKEWETLHMSIVSFTRCRAYLISSAREMKPSCGYKLHLYRMWVNRVAIHKVFFLLVKVSTSTRSKRVNCDKIRSRDVILALPWWIFFIHLLCRFAIFHICWAPVSYTIEKLMENLRLITEIYGIKIHHFWYLEQKLHWYDSIERDLWFLAAHKNWKFIMKNLSAKYQNHTWKIRKRDR